MLYSHKMNFIQTYQTKKYSNWKNKCKYIMVHHDGSSVRASDLNSVKYLATNTAKVSVQFVVWRNGDIYQLCWIDKVCRHAWKWSYKWILNTMNFFSVGIEVVSDWFSFTNEQRISVKNLIKYLMKECNISQENVIRHADYSGSRWKRDIWPNFFAEYGSRSKYQASLVDYNADTVNKSLKGNWDLWNDTNDEWLRKLLNQTNNYIRNLYWIKM